MSLLMPCFFGSPCEYINKANSIKQVQESQLRLSRAHTHVLTDPTGVVYTPFDCDVFLSQTLAFDQKYNNMQIKWCALVCLCAASARASMGQCAFESEVQLTKLYQH